MSSNNEQLTRELLNAIKTGEIDIVVDYLKKGAAPNSVNDYGTSAVAFSVIHNQKEILEILLKYGADPTIKNSGGLSAEDIASKDNHIECLKIIGKYQKKNAKKNKKGLYNFSHGKDTKTAHINYREYPRTEEFESGFYKDTVEIVNDQVQTTLQKIRNRDLGGADARTNEHLAAHFSKQIPILERQAEKPYYARLDIRRLDNGNVESYYIGSRGIYSDADRVYSAQSPFGGLFAQKKLGKIQDSDLGEIEVTLIRNIENDNGKIIQIIDKEWTEEQGYVDPVLMKKLNDHAKSKMNEIWETIQAEQDTVVRQGISVPIIVQGSAGSGKTVIALHRLSYLLYQYKGQLEEKKIMVLGPSAMYLSYIQEALPFLDVGDIRQETFEKFAIKRIPFKELRFSISDYYDIVRQNLSKADVLSSSFKGSLDYRLALKEFLKGLKDKLLPVSGVYLYTPVGEFSFPKERIDYLFCEYAANGNFESARNRIIEMLKTEYTRFKERLSLHQSSKTIELEENLENMVAEFIRKWKLPTVFDIHHDFSSCRDVLSKYLKVEPEQLETFIMTNIDNFKNRRVNYDDLAALLEIQEWLTGKIGIEDRYITNQKFDYIIIDEVQDYSPYQLAMINSLAKEGRIMMLGDLGQSIHDYRGIEDWKNVRDAFSINMLEEMGYIELSTIYRSTVQIVQFANKLIEPYSQKRYHLSEPIGREGTDPIIQKYRQKEEMLEEISVHIENLRRDDHSNIALITKSWEEAKKVYKSLAKIYPDLELIEDSSKEYKGGLLVIPVYLTKGIEYDAVILTDASMEQYQDDDHNRKLLYVAITRALHKVAVLYNENLALPMLDIIDKQKADNLRIELKNKVNESKVDNSFDEYGKFLETVQKAMEKLISQYTATIDTLKSENDTLKYELEMVRKTTMNSNFDRLETKALFEYILDSEKSIVKFLDSLNDLTTEDKEKLLVSVIQRLVQLERRRPLCEVFEYIEKEHTNFDFISDDFQERYLNVLDELLEKSQVPIKEGNIIIEKVLAFAKNSKEHTKKLFLSNSSQQLNSAVIAQENVPLILSVFQWYFELEKEEQLNSLMDYVLNNWSKLEPQFTKSNIIRLLWYTFRTKKDIKLLKIMNRELIDPKIKEVKLYLICYKVLQGDTTGSSNIPLLLQKSLLFSEKEKGILERHIFERVEIGVTN